MTVTVRNIITSMRLMSALDWTTFFEDVSLVDKELRARSDFAAMDFASRDGYRHAIEALARGSNRAELDVTRLVLALATAERGRLATAPPGETRRARSGSRDTISSDAGRRDFERSIGFQAPLSLRLRRALIDGATPVYLGLLLFTDRGRSRGAAQHPCIVRYVDRGAPRACGVRGRAGIRPRRRAAQQVYHGDRRARAAAASRAERGVPAKFRTMVVVPTLLTSRWTMSSEQVEQLEVHYLANSDGDVRFALLTDWADAPSGVRCPAMRRFSRRSREGIARLNAAARAGTRRRPRDSLCSIAAGSGTRAKACGWAGSASAASSTS